MPDVQLQGNPSNRYFKLGPIHARRVGLQPHPDYPHALVLTDEADPDSRLILPNGKDFTALELTTLANKSGDPVKGWEIYSDDPGGYPSWDLKEPSEVAS